MRIKTSYLIAAGIALAISGWLASGQLDAGKAAPEPAGPAAASDAARLPSVRVREMVAEPIQREIVINGKTAPARVVTLRAETERAGRRDRGGARRRRRGRGCPDPARSARAARDGRGGRGDADACARSSTPRPRSSARRAFRRRPRWPRPRPIWKRPRRRSSGRGSSSRTPRSCAPFAGVLDKRPVEIGDFVDIGDPVATVIEQDPFLVTGEVAESEVGKPRGRHAGQRAAGDRPSGRGAGPLHRQRSPIRPPGRSRSSSRCRPSERTLRRRGQRRAPDRSGARARPSRAGLAARAGRCRRARRQGGRRRRAGWSSTRPRSCAPTPIRIWLGGLPERLRLITVGQGFVRAGAEGDAGARGGAPAVPRPPRRAAHEDADRSELRALARGRCWRSR